MLGKSDKKAEALGKKDDDNGATDPPPPYTDLPPDYSPPGSSALPEQLWSLGLDAQSDETPSVDQCVAHLKLLECFRRLRQTISSTDGLYGIHDLPIQSSSSSLSEDEIARVFAIVAEKRWAVYISRAVERFERWVDVTVPREPRPSVKAPRGKMAVWDWTGECSGEALTLECVPPLDVILVWHAYMLCPSAYLEDCVRDGRTRLWHTPFPWNSVVDSIDPENFEMTVTDKTRLRFEVDTGCSWDSTNDNGSKSIQCPECSTLHHVPYTTYPVPSGESISEKLTHFADTRGWRGRGYADKRFLLTCDPCRDGKPTIIDHDRLCRAKFLDDVKALLSRGLPMRGTVLGNDGKCAWQQDQLIPLKCQIPNQWLLSGRGDKLISEFEKPEARRRCKTLSDVEQMIVNDLGSEVYLKDVRPATLGPLRASEKEGCQLMLSRYQETNTPHAIDLVGAVIRNGDFVESMHNAGWLRSGSDLRSIIASLITKYNRFAKLQTEALNIPLAATIEVELAWQTHRLSPSTYFKACLASANDHNSPPPKIPFQDLHSAHMRTSKLYEKRYQTPYTTCTCWYCAAVRESHVSRASSLIWLRSGKKREHCATPASVHLAVHNAVRCPKDGAVEAEARTQAAELDELYQKTCQRARKEGREQPARGHTVDGSGQWVKVNSHEPSEQANAGSGALYAIDPWALLGSEQLGQLRSSGLGGPHAPLNNTLAFSGLGGGGG